MTMQLVTTNPQITTFPPPDRYAFEREVKSFLPRKALERVSELTRKDQAAVSAAFNPNREDRHNPVYMILVYLWAFDQVADGIADRMLSLVVRERRKWLSAKCRGDVCHPTLTKSIGVEYVEAIEMEMNGASLDVKIKEFTDLRDAVDKKLDSLIAEKQKQYGGEVRNETRDKVRELMNNRRNK
jgi:hypothetical protein